MFTQFQEWRENRHQYAMDWKERTGGKVVGYFCTYVPEEILYAAGTLPVRILGSHEPQDVTEPHIFAMFCPFCRDCLAQGLKGRFDYLDGLTIAQSCLHIRQAFTSWIKHRPVDWDYYLCMPHKVQSPRALPFYTGELEDYKKSVEEWTGKTIRDEELDKAIEVYNKNRRLMHEVYELRKQDNPPISGRDAMEMVIASQCADKEEHNKELERILPELREMHNGSNSGTRLMILGSEDDDIGFVDMVERVGGTFVTDDHCTGTRYFWNEVIPEDNRLKAIAKRYIERPPCPTKDWEERTRLPFILKLAKEANVQGAILVQMKFCTPHELDIPATKKLLEDNGIDTLSLEFDVTVPYGQFQTRVEAFLEMISEEDLF